MGRGETETRRGHKQGIAHTRTQGRGAATPQETERDLPVRVWGSPEEGWAGSGLPQQWGHWRRQSWEMRLSKVLLGVPKAPL